MKEKVFEYAVGDSWLLSLQNHRAVYTVKDCFFRETDGKEIYEVEIDGTTVQRLTRNRLHFLLYRHLFKKLKTGKYQKYSSALSADAIRKYYAGISGDQGRNIVTVAEIGESGIFGGGYIRDRKNKNRIGNGKEEKAVGAFPARHRARRSEKESILRQVRRHGLYARRQRMCVRKSA